MLFFSTEQTHLPSPPGISVTPETPLDFQPSFQDHFDNPDGPQYDHTDGAESTGSLSPQMRPRVTSNISRTDAKKKLALKFRKKKGQSSSPSASPDPSRKSDSVSQHEEEDVDEIFKNYEAQNGESKQKPEYLGKKKRKFYSSNFIYLPMVKVSKD